MIRLTASRATNFYYSFAFLSPEKRRAMEAVYAFARRGDDLVDNGLAPDEARRRLAEYRLALDRCYDRALHPRANAPAAAKPSAAPLPLEEQAGVEALAEAAATMSSAHRSGFRVP